MVKFYEKGFSSFEDANFFAVMMSLTLGSILLMLILLRYLVTQKRFTQWSQPKSEQSISDNNTEAGLAYSSTISSKRIGIQKIQSKSGGIYDRWLMIRFFMAFLMLAYGPLS